MAFTRPLAVAIAAAVLLVIVVGADATMDRSLHVDRRDADGAWVTLASAGEIPPEEQYRPYPDATVRVEDRNDTLRFRARVENGYPWGYDKEYVAYVQGVEVARGTLLADGRSSGASEFDVPVSRLLGSSVEKPVPGDARDTYYGAVEVRVGRLTLYAGVNVEVAS